MKILNYVDGSVYTQNILKIIGDYKQNDIFLIHIVPQGCHSDRENTDYSLTLDLDSRNKLLEKLVNIDAQRSKIYNERAHIILEHAAEHLKTHFEIKAETILERGDFSDILSHHAQDKDLLIVGKQREGEAGRNVTSYLETIIRSAQKPILAVSDYYTPFKQAVFAFDGSVRNQRALDFLEKHHFATLTDIHILVVDNHSSDIIAQAEDAQRRLNEQNYQTVLTFKEGRVAPTIEDYIVYTKSDLLIAGAYGHSQVRHFFVGSTTDRLLKAVKTSILLF
ncbi:MAG: universal stress protein [Pseudomonadota bacterium]